VAVGESVALPDGLGLVQLQLRQGGEGLRLPTAREPMSVRFQVTPGIMLKPVGRSGSRRFKKLLQEYGVPSWQRGRIPILYYGEQVAAVAGLFICDGFMTRAAGMEWHWLPAADSYIPE
jgi:tRNA(Ile)-lysidine synthase